MTGADAMVKCLEAQGIGVVFGYPGVAIAPFYNSLYDSNIKSILVRQEQNGGHDERACAHATQKQVQRRLPTPGQLQHVRHPLVPMTRHDGSFGSAIGTALPPADANRSSSGP